MSTASAERIAKMPPAELRMLQALNDQEVAKAKKENKPAPSLMDTLETMTIAKTKALVGADPTTVYQKYTVDWNKMPTGVRLEYEKMKPPITTAAEYAKYMMGLTPTRSNPNPTGGGSGTPPPPEGFVTNPLN
jgi:hypothetical protein